VAVSVAGDPADTAVRLGPADAGRCRRRIHLDFDPTADRTVRRDPDPGFALRRSDLADHREITRARLAGLLPVVDAREAPRDEVPGSGSVPGVLTDRPAFVWGARLSSGDRHGVVDLLVRAPDGGYLPVVVKGHRTLDPGEGAACSPLADPLRTGGRPERRMRAHHADGLALAHLTRLLDDLGLSSADRRGGVIGKGGPAADPSWDDGSAIVWHRLDRPQEATASTGAPPSNGGSGARPANGGPLPTGSPAGEAAPGPSLLEEYDARFADRLAVAVAAATRRPALAVPSRISECRRCPWWPRCSVELEAAHDVSLVVAGGDVDILHAAGIRTYDELAGLPADVAAALPLTAIAPAEARVRAVAVREGIPLIRRSAPVRPQRADVELDVDMESYLDDGAYLWGTYLSGRPLEGFHAGYRPFVTWEPLAEPGTGENFAAFWRYLTALRSAAADAGATFAAFCYSRMAEERWLFGLPQRFPDVPGMPAQPEIADFCRSPQWVDVYAELRQWFVVPGSLRLKAVAAVSGFAWRDPEPSGENSMAWYRTAVTDPDPAVAAASRERLLRYNEDDVLATLSLRRWMTAESWRVPTVAELG
jgi:predicted RecB family nuclease